MTPPALSVILATPDTWQSCSLTLRYLRAQSIAGEIELVLAGPEEASLHLPDSFARAFHSVQRVAVGPLKSIAAANAAAIRNARAPIVALAEDHCFPEPGWAAALVRAHKSPQRAAVGPAIRNANPATAVSWCDFVIGYGPWMHPAAPGNRPFLPGHNSSYKREVLLAYGNRLEAMLESETVLHIELARHGHALYLEPEARAAHTNFALTSSWFPVQFHAGRVFGAARARGWPLLKRLFYAAASPLIPLVRFARCLRQLLGRTEPPLGRTISIAPMLFAGLVLDGAGQFCGYLLGPGNAVEQVAKYEFHRFRHVPETDRRQAEELAPQ